MKDDIALDRTKSPGNPTQDINWDSKWPRQEGAVGADGSETGEKENTEQEKKCTCFASPCKNIRPSELHNSLIC